MKRSIRYRITLIFMALMAAMLFSIWAVNNWWLERFYTSQKLKVLEEAYTTLDAVVMEKVEDGENIIQVLAEEAEKEWKNWNHNFTGDLQDGEPGPEDNGTRMPRKSDESETDENDEIKIEEPLDELDENSLLHAIREYGEKNNIAVVLIDSTTGQALALKSAVRDGDWLVRKVQSYVLDQRQSKSEVLAAHENYTVEKNYDPRSRSSYMECWGFFSDNSTMFIMQMPLASIHESVMLSNRFTARVGIAVLVLGGILTFFVTKRVTNPLMRLASLSARMSHLDFDASYEGHAEDEIGVLGRSMNTLSDKLKEVIGELQAANAQLQKDIEEKIQIDEMRKEFIANVSHELKTPIALIQGYAEGLTEGMCEDEESRSYYCEVIMDEAAKMNKMVKQLLTLTALEFGKDAPVLSQFDVSELIHDLVNTSGILFQQKEAKVELDVESPLLVRADEFKIEEVLANYLTNAMNHLEGDKVIRIRTERMVAAEGAKVKICVCNSGNSIPEEDIENLWTKFYKVDKARTRAYGGSGIGLSIVKAIMEAHSQFCGVENVAGGVEFWFTLETES